VRRIFKRGVCRQRRPLGLELGVATYAQVKQQVGSKTSLSGGGTNKYSGGKMLQGNGSGLGVEGLSEITFIFDEADTLAAVLMTLPEDSFGLTLKALSRKYKLVSKELHLGGSSAHLRQDNSVIDIKETFFNTTVSYMTKKFNLAFSQQSSNERAAAQKRQADMF
jgi:hypothetical protein